MSTIFHRLFAAAKAADHWPQSARNRVIAATAVPTWAISLYLSWHNYHDNGAAQRLRAINNSELAKHQRALVR